MADKPDDDHHSAQAADALREILDALAVTAERIMGLPDGTVAR